MAIVAWAEVPSYPGILVSSDGDVMVEPHPVPRHHGGVWMAGGKPTRGQWDGKRYIYPRKGFKTMKVHRLVCEGFHGQPQPGQVCMHLNEDAADNRPENLAWGTQKENLNAPGFIAYCKSRTGQMHPRKRMIDDCQKVV